MLSIVVLALNEEKLLRATLDTIHQSQKEAGGIAIEIIIVNDGSIDRTPEVIRQLESEYSWVRSIHHDSNLGIGKSFLDAVEVARFPYVTVFCGDNDTTVFTMTSLFRSAGKADLVLSYVMNTEERSFLRNLISRIFGFIYTITFNIHVQYVHGGPIYRVEDLRKLALKSDRYSLFVEINVKLLRSGVTYLEVPAVMNPEAKKTSSALRMKNLVEVLKSYLRLILEVYVFERERYSKRSKRILDF